ncbi:MAG: DUF1934 domain-containing protein [Oscillospiraceae bacterium]|jgi:uncharacterized beta-barrel protein YwiB (DUF1934 family)|nr:DUF1934 domain-containing protein [Oscillospiraceae bacterium]
MDKEVSINIKSVQTAENMKDTTELFTRGRLKRGRARGNYTIVYEESEATGFDGNTVSFAVKGDDMVVMQRRGNSPTDIIVEKGKKHHCHYGTPYGDFMVGITAGDIKGNLKDDGGDLYLKYTIDINSSLMSENEMFIDFKELGRDGKSQIANK